MTKVQLIGLRTAAYDDIKATLVSYIELNRLNVDFSEINNPQDILDLGFLSIPLVSIGESRIYFSESNFMDSLQELKVHLGTVQSEKKKKKHSCKNCGNCKCPADLKN